MTDNPARPDSVRIMAHIYQIDWRDSDPSRTGLLGECDNSNDTIMVCTQAPISRQAEVLLHEMVHAYAFNWKPEKVADPGECEEAFAEFSGQCFSLMLSQNPNAILWCMKQLV